MNNDNEQVPLTQALTEFAIGLDRILEGGEAGELIREARDEIDRLQSALATARREALEEAAVMRNALLPFARFAEYIEAGRPGWYHNGFTLIDDERMPPLQMSVFINARRALLSQSVEVGPTSSGNGGAGD